MKPLKRIWFMVGAMIYLIAFGLVLLMAYVFVMPAKWIMTGEAESVDDWLIEFAEKLDNLTGLQKLYEEVIKK